MSAAAGRSTNTNSLRRRGLHSICTALSEKLNGEKKAKSSTDLLQMDKMEQVNPATMNLGSVHGRVITSVSHGTTNAPVVLAAALSNIAEHSYAAMPVPSTSNGNAKEKGKTSDGSSSSSSGESSSSESEVEEMTASKEVATAVTNTSTQQTVITVNPPPTVEGVKPTLRVRSQPQKYVDEMKKYQGMGTPAQQKTTTPKVIPTTKGRTSTPRQASEKAELATPERRRGRGCGKCPGCQRPDCGTCVFCKDKPKFGGPGVKKQRCALRTCANFVKKVCVHNQASLGGSIYCNFYRLGVPEQALGGIPLSLGLL